MAVELSRGENIPLESVVVMCVRGGLERVGVVQGVDLVVTDGKVGGDGASIWLVRKERAAAEVVAMVVVVGLYLVRGVTRLGSMGLKIPAHTHTHHSSYLHTVF